MQGGLAVFIVLLIIGAVVAAPNISHVKSALAIRSAKQQPGVPVSLDDD